MIKPIYKLLTTNLIIFKFNKTNHIRSVNKQITKVKFIYRKMKKEIKNDKIYLDEINYIPYHNVLLLGQFFSSIHIRVLRLVKCSL